MKPQSILPALLLGCLLGTTSPGWATSFVERPFPETVANAPVIARGKIGSSYAEWGKGEDGVKRLYTYYELLIDETLKGKAPGRSVLIRELGGEKDGVGMQVSGASQFERGEDVVVMLGEKNGEGSFDVRGLMMGKLNVRQNESGKEILEGPALGLRNSDHNHDHGNSSAGGAQAQKEWALDALRQVIQTQSSSGEGNAEANSGNDSTSSPAKPTPGSTSQGLEGASQAPQLQNSESEPARSAETSESQDSSLPLWLGLALGGAGVVAWMRSRRRRR